MTHDVVVVRVIEVEVEVLVVVRVVVIVVGIVIGGRLTLRHISDPIGLRSQTQNLRCSSRGAGSSDSSGSCFRRDSSGGSYDWLSGPRLSEGLLRVLAC